MASSLIPLPDVVAAPSANVMADARALSAPLIGLQSLAQGVADVGRTAGAFAERAAQAKNAADIVRARNAMGSAEADFSTWQATEQDESKWSQGNEEAMAKAENAIAGLDLSPMARQHVDLELGDWKAKRRAKVGHDSSMRTAQNADRVFQNATLEAADKGDVKGVDWAIGMRVDLGLLHESEAAAVRKQMMGRADYAQASQWLNEAPIAFVEAIEEKDKEGNWKFWKDLDEVQRLQLKNRGRVQVAAVREETVQEFALRVANGESITKAELDVAVEQGKLKPTQAQWLSKQAKGNLDYADSFNRMVEITEQIAAYSPTMKDAELMRREIGTSIALLPKEMRGPLETQMRGRSDNSDDSIRSRLAEEFIHAQFANEQKTVEEKIKALEADDDLDEDVMKRQVDSLKAYRDSLAGFRYQALTDTWQFQKMKPGATAEEIMANVKAKMQTMTMRGSSKAVFNSVTGTN